MIEMPDVSWIKKKEQLSLNALKTPNRIDDSVSFRGHTIKTIEDQRQKDPKVDISDAMFNNIPSFGPGASVPFNKARLKLFGPKINKVTNFIGPRKEIKYI